MKKTEIKLTIDLDDANVPQSITWESTDAENKEALPVKSMMLALWDHNYKNTLRIDLWTKDMPVDEMKRFYIDCVGGIGQSVLTSTGDEAMASEINNLCEKLALMVRNSER